MGNIDTIINASYNYKEVKMFIEHITENAFLVLRIVVAVLCGFAIGFERKYKMKEAGIRTHTIVALGAVIFTVVSIYGFAGASDGARVAAQIVTGVGFLGAGMIFFRKEALHGLTTAAGIWATAAIGMAIGAGMYLVGIFATILIIALHLIFNNKKLFSTKRYHTVNLEVVPSESCLERIKEFFNVKEFENVKIKKNSEILETKMSIRLKTFKLYSSVELQEFMDANNEITYIERDEEG